MTRTDMPKLLLEKGYSPLRLQERIVASAASRALAILGKQSVAALLYHMSSRTGLKEEELLSNYLEFERALWASLGYAADLLLKRFSDELARSAGKNDVGLGEILEEIRRNEHTVFARSVSQGENMALLYTSAGFRDRIVSAFFEPVEGEGTMAALIEEKPSALPPSVVRTTYGELQAGHNRTALDSRVAEWASAMRLAGSPLRLAKDNTWIVENGLPEPSHDAIGAKSTALLCAYDLSRIDGASAAKAAELHDFVVVEGLRAIYRR